jgi:helicase
LASLLAELVWSCCSRRLKGRDIGAPRFVFISAIIPNVEEINAWLGGSANSIIRSEYRPALAEFGVLRESRGDNAIVNLEVHPHLPDVIRFTVASDQGAVGIAEELLEQLSYPLGLPAPSGFTNAERLAVAVDYLNREFGEQWNRNPGPWLSPPFSITGTSRRRHARSWRNSSAART